MLFKDREEAGQKLALALLAYQDQPETIVIGLPRGGVVVAFEVAKRLKLSLDIVSPRKIGAPQNPELAIGAITETGEAFLDPHLITYLGVSEEYIEKKVEEEKKKAQHRLQIYRKERPPRDLKGKCVLVVDDGLATGATMKAAVRSIRAEGATKVIVAVPVAPIDTCEALKQLADEVICLSTPVHFQAVGEFYQLFDQTTDEEVIALLQNL